MSSEFLEKKSIEYIEYIESYEDAERKTESQIDYKKIEDQLKGLCYL